MENVFRIGLITALILLNGYFVASEFALITIRKTRVDILARKGNTSAKILQNVLRELNQYISATQLGITIASLALGWVGESALVHIIEPFFSFLPENIAWLTAHSIAVVIAFTFITFIQIVFGELVPKSLALRRSETVALFVIRPLVFFSQVFKPFISFLNYTGQLVLKIFHITAPSERQLIHSEEEVRSILRQSSESGAIPAKEVEMVYNVFQLGDIPVKVIMVPRTEIVAFPIAAQLRDIIPKIENNVHSRFPVYEHSVDTIIGFFHVKDVYRAALKKSDTVRLFQLDIVRKIINVPEVKKIDSVLQEMRREHIHLAVVNDEYGKTAGVITLEDIIESVVGEIEDEFDQPVRDISKQSDGSYMLAGHTLIRDLQQKFHLPLKGQGYTTIGGLVFGLLGHEPHIGDKVEISNLNFEVTGVEGKRITLLRLKKRPKAN